MTENRLLKILQPEIGSGQNNVIHSDNGKSGISGWGMYHGLLSIVGKGIHQLAMSRKIVLQSPGKFVIFTIFFIFLLSANFVSAQQTPVYFNNVDPTPTMSFNASAYWINENAGQIVLKIVKTGPSDLTSSVRYAASGGNASAGVNYQPKWGTLNFSSTDVEKSITINVMNDGAYDTQRYFVVTLINSTNATIATPAVNVYINNTDPAPVIQFDVSACACNDTEGFAYVNVTKTGKTNLDTLVSYGTAAGNATPGVHYCATAGTLVLGPDETSKNITVPLLYGNTTEQKTFFASLSAPVNGVLGSRSSMQISMGHNELSPSILWYKTYGGSSSDNAYSVRQTSDGGYVMAGYTDFVFNPSIAPPNDVTSKAYLAKTDVNGNLQWSRTFGGSSADMYFSVQQTRDGGFILTGGNRSYFACVFKTDPTGIIVWERLYPNLWIINSICQTADGGYIMTGDGSLTHEDDDVMLVKLDPNGLVQWQKSFGGDGSDSGYDVKVTSDGGYVIAGFYAPSMSGPFWSMYLVKTDASGNKMWDDIFNMSGNSFGHSVQQTTDGGYVIGGHADNGAKVDACLVKTDSAGNVLFSKSYSVWGYDYVNYVCQTHDGGYAFAGEADPYGGVFLGKTDSRGNLLWVKKPGVQDDESFSALQSTDDSYVVTGFTVASGHGDIFLTKIGGMSAAVAGDTIKEGSPYNGQVAVAGTKSSSWNVAVNFGDGTTVNVSRAGQLFSLPAHVYANEGVYYVRVDVSGDAGLSCNNTTAVKVLNAAPSAVVVTGSTPLEVNSPFSGTATFSDPGTNTWSAVVDYGDGSSPVSFSVSARSFALPGHVYAYEGDYVVNVTVNDDHNAAGTGYFTVNVRSMATNHIDLSVGWNLITFPLDTTWHASDLTGNTSLGVDMVSVYNNTTGAYTTYYSGATSWKNMPLSSDRGYFLHSTKRSSFNLVGRPVSAHYLNICRGWNLIGWTSSSTITASDVLTRATLSMVSRYNNSAGIYQTYYTGANPSKNFTLKYGEGYFLRSEVSTVQQLFVG